jgi:hydrogenase maturation protein HypF
MPATRTRLRVRISGVVQGVGFRPFVHRLAGELGLAGHVGNDAAGVFIEVEGPAPAVDAFTVRVSEDAPPLAHVHDVQVTSMRPLAGAAGTGATTFRIVASPAGGAVATLVPPDIAICGACRTELFDPGDRRYRHPFTTCTDCGPRYTIVTSLPYDRPATTMAGFVMCEACRREYHDPTDRRFHAQPIACPDCGPTLRYEAIASSAGVHTSIARLRGGAAQGGPVMGTEPALVAAQRRLAEGGTIAVKGIGGFHLACDATSPAAVALLRRRKQRPDKPFAVMVADVEVARAIALCSERELAALTSPQRPVVLVRRHAATAASGPTVADEVAPGNPWLGVMLPSSPLHELLLAPRADGTRLVPSVLVMTSGNVSGEPICFEDGDAHARLTPLVDGFLLHDRPIHVPCDDGVVREIDGEVVPIRRSRGDAPLPLRLPAHAPPMLAVGAELKNTVGVASGHQAWLSQHIGDLGALETLQAFERAAEQLTRFFQIDPEHVAVDPHPSYATHAWARRQHRERLRPVQHHHAHAAALLAEHGVGPDEVALVVTFDGTGYGTDHTVWGGEVLLASQATAVRAAHLATVPLPGGDSAVTNPARMALAQLWAAQVGWDEALPCVVALTGAERELLQRQLERDVACVPTSSAGRLFDAVSALLGVRQRITYEGQAAIELEWLADAWSQAGNADQHAPRYRFAIRPARAAGGPAAGGGQTSDARVGADAPVLVLDPAPVLRAVVADVLAGVDRTAIAAGFHLAVTAVIVAVADHVAAAGGPRTVGLTGGVFQNAWLTTRTRTRLEQRGHTVLTHRLVPANDGGLAYGQLAAVAAQLASDASDAGDARDVRETAGAASDRPAHHRPAHH